MIGTGWHDGKYYCLAIHLLVHVHLKYGLPDFSKFIKDVLTANPEGISGSGLWLLIGEDGRPLPDPRLIGIVSEYHENSAVIIATKIDLYVNVILQRFDPTLPNNGVSIDLDWVDKP